MNNRIESDIGYENRENHEYPSGEEAMDEYLLDIKKYPKLSEPENRRLIALAQGGDVAARNEVIQGNLKLVIFVAKRYSHVTTMDELVAEGNLGLFTAVQKFDLTRTILFGTYAHWWIRNNITRMLAEPPYRGAVHIPQSMWQKVVREDGAHLTGHDRRMFESAKASLLSVNGQWDCPDPRVEEPVEQMYRQDEQIQVSELLRRANLSPRQKFILNEYIVNGATLQDLSDKLSISKQRVRMVKEDALEKLRKLMNEFIY